jgi:DNA repair exonuclease SbcCD ATPase subunit
MRIVSLEAQNVKRLKAVSIKPDGDMVVIGGRNEQGKTSLLDSIQYALGGKNGICEKPLREGEKRGHVILDLGELIVKRTFTAAGGSELTVTSADGSKKFNGPQAVLDKLYSSVSFDPLAFMRMKPAEQRTVIMELAGLDFTELDQRYAQTFEQRRDVNRDLKRAQQDAADAVVHEDAPDAEISVSELSRELSEALNVQSARARLVAEAERKRESVARITEEIDRLSRQIAELRSQRTTLRDESDAEARAAAEIEVPDIPSLEARIEAAESINAKVTANHRAAAIREAAAELQADADALSATLESIDVEKKTQLAAANLPVPGLSFDEDGVLLNGLPISQASGAMQLRLSVAIGAALNPDLKVLLVRDGSLLDSESLALMADLATEHDMQVWMERVGEGEEVTVVIEDGSIR